jgi:hypothetical protein
MKNKKVSKKIKSNCKNYPCALTEKGMCSKNCEWYED